MRDNYFQSSSFYAGLLLIFGFVAMVAVGVVNSYADQPRKSDERPCPCCKDGTITIKGEDGTGSVLLKATKDGPGIWLTSPNGDTVAITAFANHCGVMLLPKDSPGGASPLALAISGKSAYIQVRDKNDRVIMIPVEKLGRAAAWLQTQPKE